MKKLRQKLYILLALFVIIIGFGSWMILIQFHPELAFKDYPIIPIYFFIVGCISISVLSRVKYDTSTRLISTLMMERGLKMFTTLILGLIYWLLDRAEIRSFAIMLGAFYILYLFFETYMYVQIENWHKQNKKQQSNLENAEKNK
ncbi:MAG: hypothetical protein GXZ03_08310 [Proteiniphilum sp.]|nr:hypothetical protein [Proteiniphilum sp.]